MRGSNINVIVLHNAPLCSLCPRAATFTVMVNIADTVSTMTCVGIKHVKFGPLVSPLFSSYTIGTAKPPRGARQASFMSVPSMTHQGLFAQSHAAGTHR